MVPLPDRITGRFGLAQPLGGSVLAGSRIHFGTSRNSATDVDTRIPEPYAGVAFWVGGLSFWCLSQVALLSYIGLVGTPAEKQLRQRIEHQHARPRRQRQPGVGTVADSGAPAARLRAGQGARWQPDSELLAAAMIGTCSGKVPPVPPNSREPGFCFLSPLCCHLCVIMHTREAKRGYIGHWRNRRNLAEHGRKRRCP